MFNKLAFILACLFSGALSAQTVLVLGDSLSAGYGLSSVDQGWVFLLQQRLAVVNGDRVVNASISGDTTSGGRARLPGLLAEHKPGLVLVELGANDGLRGLSPAQMKTNLNEIIGQSRAAGAAVVLIGMRLPPNYGRRYAEAFEGVFPVLAKESGVPLVPFMLDGVGGQTQYMQADGLHPNEAAQPVIFDNVWRAVQPLVGGQGKR
ncbi:arylesterase [Methylotetracoccus oryzae]|uniref:arylesterase n=1 Tax=Methylotetracoccus oryzae TaxID=1919059 RepID=UPI00111BC898|nr:arylesterase [Methylotetracoccus oryzae]